jgi:hypothetical protein
MCCVSLARDGAPSADQIAEGQRLAQELRSTRPTGDSEIRGTLITSHGNKKHVPIVCRTVTTGGVWKTIYESQSADGVPAERLIITRSPDGVQYAYARAATAGAPIPEPKTISAEQANIPFAQSDFWLTDLGVQFIFWPEQARLKGELRLGRDCYLLESTNPGAAQVVRIKAYIDKENKVPILAEGYDARNKLVKEFSIHGSGFKRIHGQWVLEKMDMHNAKTGSQTVLKFDLSKE